MRISLHGAGIRLRGHKAEAFLFNTKFYNAHSTFRGSAAAVSEGAKLDVRSSWFGHNSGHWGGALYVATGGQVHSGHTLFENNYATASGGAVAIISNGTFECASCELRGNSCAGMGGAIAVLSNGELETSFNFYKDSHAGAGGGAIYGYHSARLILSGPEFCNNSVGEVGTEAQLKAKAKAKRAAAAAAAAAVAGQQQHQSSSWKDRAVTAPSDEWAATQQAAAAEAAQEEKNEDDDGDDDDDEEEKLPPKPSRRPLPGETESARQQRVFREQQAYTKAAEAAAAKARLRKLQRLTEAEDAAVLAADGGISGGLSSGAHPATSPPSCARSQTIVDARIEVAFDDDHTLNDDHEVGSLTVAG